MLQTGTRASQTYPHERNRSFGDQVRLYSANTCVMQGRQCVVAQLMLDCIKMYKGMTVPNIRPEPKLCNASTATVPPQV